MNTILRTLLTVVLLLGDGFATQALALERQLNTSSFDGKAINKRLARQLAKGPLLDFGPIRNAQGRVLPGQMYLAFVTPKGNRRFLHLSEAPSTAKGRASFAGYTVLVSSQVQMSGSFSEEEGLVNETAQELWIRGIELGAAPRSLSFDQMVNVGTVVSQSWYRNSSVMGVTLRSYDASGAQLDESVHPAPIASSSGSHCDSVRSAINTVGTAGYTLAFAPQGMVAAMASAGGEYTGSDHIKGVSSLGGYIANGAKSFGINYITPFYAEVAGRACDLAAGGAGVDLNDLAVPTLNGGQGEWVEALVCTEWTSAQVQSGSGGGINEDGEVDVWPVYQTQMVCTDWTISMVPAESLVPGS